MIPVLNPASLNSFMVSRRFIGLGAPGSNILAISSFSVENEKDIIDTTIKFILKFTW